MSNQDLSIRFVESSDYDQWRRLYNGYGTFYKRDMTDEIANAVWSWLHDPNHEMEGLVAERNETLIGLAHFRRMPRPLSGAHIGFLDDLFVDPEARGSQIGERLISELSQISKERGWNLIRWLTADNNYRARALYDRVAKKTSWNLYELVPQ